MVVGGAYGRDYKNAESVQSDWNEGKDFVILEHPRYVGSYINKQDAAENGLKTIVVRYNGGRNRVSVRT